MEKTHATGYVSSWHKFMNINYKFMIAIPFWALILLNSTMTYSYWSHLFTRWTDYSLSCTPHLMALSFFSQTQPRIADRIFWWCIELVEALPLTNKQTYFLFASIFSSLLQQRKFFHSNKSQALHLYYESRPLTFLGKFPFCLSACSPECSIIAYF